MADSDAEHYNVVGLDARCWDIRHKAGVEDWGMAEAEDTERLAGCTRCTGLENIGAAGLVGILGVDNALLHSCYPDCLGNCPLSDRLEDGHRSSMRVLGCQHIHLLSHPGCCHGRVHADQRLPGYSFHCSFDANDLVVEDNSWHLGAVVEAEEGS